MTWNESWNITTYRLSQIQSDRLVIQRHYKHWLKIKIRNIKRQFNTTCAIVSNFVSAILDSKKVGISDYIMKLFHDHMSPGRHFLINVRSLGFWFSPCRPTYSFKSSNGIHYYQYNLKLNIKSWVSQVLYNRKKISCWEQILVVSLQTAYLASISSGLCTLNPICPRRGSIIKAQNQDQT